MAWLRSEVMIDSLGTYARQGVKDLTAGVVLCGVGASVKVLRTMPLRAEFI